MRDDKGRFIKGHSGNPDGRPEGRSNPIATLTKTVEDLLQQEGNREKVAEELLRLATSHQARGQIPAISMIWERLEGKVADKHLIQGLIVHIGNDYARLGLEANQLDVESRNQRYLEADTT